MYNGAACITESSNIMFFGYRKDPKSSGVLGQYAFKTNVPNNIALKVEERVSELAETMESTAMYFVVDRKEEYTLFQQVQSILDIPTISKSSEGLSTQLSISVNYWSIAHRDSDYFFTFLSCLSGNHKLHDETVYYFCFPEHKIAIPLKLRDVIVFNPLALHCCSNCQNDDSFIWSTYVLEKTVMSAGIGKYV